MNKINNPDEKKVHFQNAPSRKFVNLHLLPTFLFAIYILAIFPLVCNFTDYMYYDLTELKLMAFLPWAFVFALIMIGGIIVYLISKAIKKQLSFECARDLIKNTSLAQVFFIIYGMLIVVSTLLSPYAGYMDWVYGNGRYESVLMCELYILLFLFTSTLGVAKGNSIFTLFAVSMSIFSIVGIMQYLRINPFGYKLTIVNSFGTRPAQFYTTVGNVNMVAGFLALAIPAFIAGLCAIKSKLKYLLIIPIFLCAFLMGLIQTDSAFVGVAAAIALLPILYFNTPERIAGGFFGYATLAVGLGAFSIFDVQPDTINIVFGKSAILFFGIAALLIAIGALILFIKHKINLSKKAFTISWSILLTVTLVSSLTFIYFSEFEGTRSLPAQIQMVMKGDFADELGSSRGFIWKRALQMIGDYPLLGTGADTFIFTFQEKFEEEILIIQKIFDFAHNDFLQIACNFGLISLCVYLAALISLFIKGLRLKEKHPSVIILVLGLFGYMVHVFFSFSIVIISPLIWVSLGLLDGYCRRLKKGLEPYETKFVEKHYWGVQ